MRMISSLIAAAIVGSAFGYAIGSYVTSPKPAKADREMTQTQVWSLVPNVYMKAFTDVPALALSPSKLEDVPVMGNETALTQNFASPITR